jgi:hypothetical protein
LELFIIEISGGMDAVKVATVCVSVGAAVAVAVFSTAGIAVSVGGSGLRGVAVISGSPELPLGKLQASIAKIKANINKNSLLNFIVLSFWVNKPGQIIYSLLLM